MYEFIMYNQVCILHYSQFLCIKMYEYDFSTNQYNFLQFRVFLVAENRNIDKSNTSYCHSNYVR